MSNFNLKSYFTFLSRNKTYTAVNVFGLAVSLTFVIIIGLYTWQEFYIDRQHSKAKRIYNIGLNMDDGTWRTANCHHAVLRYLRSRYPEIEQTCGFTAGSLKLKDNGNFVNLNVLEADSTFFSMFDFPFVQGNRTNSLDQKGNIVLTESAARRLFGNTTVIGRTLTTAENNHFRVTGVVKDFDNTFIDKDIQGVIDFSYTINMANMDENFPHMVNITGASFPPTVMAPLSTSQNRAIRWQRVVFPLPEGPTGAIGAFAYGIPKPAVDGNVLRVISRITGSREDIMKQAVRRRVEEALEAVIPTDHASDFNQGLIELGAIVCVPNGEPRCEECPAAHLCAARQQGIISEIPVKSKAKERRVENRTVLVFKDGKKLAIRKRPSKGLLAGLYEFPNLEGRLTMEAVTAYSKEIGLMPVRVRKLENAKHIFSHIEWHMIGYEVIVDELEKTNEKEFLFIEPEEIGEKYPIPSAFEAYTRYGGIVTGNGKKTSSRR